MIRRLLPEPDKATRGCHEISARIHLEVVEERSWKQHSQVHASLPEGGPIEAAFVAAPIFSYSCGESFVDAVCRAHARRKFFDSGGVTSALSHASTRRRSR